MKVRSRLPAGRLQTQQRDIQDRKKENQNPKKVKTMSAPASTTNLPWPTSTAGSGSASSYVAWLSEHVRASTDSIQTALRATQFGVSLRRTPLTPQHNRRGPGVELALDPAGSGFTTHSRVRKMLASMFSGRRNISATLQDALGTSRLSERVAEKPCTACLVLSSQ